MKSQYSNHQRNKDLKPYNNEESYSSKSLDYGTMDEINTTMGGQSQSKATYLSSVMNDEELNTVFSNFVDQIEAINLSLKLNKFFSFISIIASFVILCLKLSETKGNKFSWLYLNIPVIISIIFLTIIVNLYLYLKKVIDKAEKISFPQKSSPENGSTIFTYVLLFLVSICLIIFSLLSTFYLEDKILTRDKDAIFVFLPIFIGIFCLIIYTIFMSPAFCSNGFGIGLGLIYLNIISFGIFMIMLCLKINNNLGHNNLDGVKFSYVFIPLYFMLGADLVYLILNEAIFGKNKNNEGQNLFMNNGENGMITNSQNINMKKNIYFVINIASLTILLVALIITNLKLDNTVANKNNYIEGILVLVSYLIFMSKTIYEIFADINDENNNN